MGREYQRITYHCQAPVGVNVIPNPHSLQPSSLIAENELKSAHYTYLVLRIHLSVRTQSDEAPLEHPLSFRHVDGL